ncbi:MAG: hypothetical protein V4586_19480 [Pseudomonadota bacterium]
MYAGIAAVLAVIAGLAVLRAVTGAYELDRSALGVAGLSRIAPELGLTFQEPAGWGALKASALSLRVLPLYDLDLNSEDQPAASLQERLGQTTLRELDASVFYDKISALETLIVLPKWRGAVVVTGGAHRTFLIDPVRFRAILVQAYLDYSVIRHATDGFVEEDVRINGQSVRVALFQPQTIHRVSIPTRCKELAGLAEGALLIHCDAVVGRPAMSVLSDPDLLNNHGITLARNADFVVAALRGLQAPGEKRPIYLDTTTEDLLAPEADEEAQPYQRDTQDMLRFFAWPLSLFWLAGAAVFLVAIWRGAMRFGPVQQVAEDRLEVSKLAAIDAKARLIRLSRNDGRMVAEFTLTRLQNLAHQTFGAGGGQVALDRLYAKFTRQNPTDAAELRACADVLQSSAGTLHPSELRRILDRFAELLERLTHGPS